MANMTSPAVHVAATSEQGFNVKKKHEIVYEWTVQNFSKLPRLLWSVEKSSPHDCDSKTLWRVELRFISGTRKYNSITLLKKLHRTDSREISVQTLIQLTLTDKNGSEIFESTFDSNVPPKFKSTPTSMTSWLDDPGFFSLPDDELVVRVSLVIKGCCSRTGSQCRNVHQKQFQNDMRNAYQESIHADVEIAHGRDSIYVNKFVLCSRSPIFHEILLEKASGRIRYDFSYSKYGLITLRAFMFYLYTGFIDRTLNVSVFDNLYRMAAKYEVSSLQHACGQVLLSNLNFSSACGILILADKYSDESLKLPSMEFIKNNANEIKASHHWQCLVKWHKPLYAKLLAYIS